MCVCVRNAHTKLLLESNYVGKNKCIFLYFNLFIHFFSKSSYFKNLRLKENIPEENVKFRF